MAALEAAQERLDAVLGRFETSAQSFVDRLLSGAPEQEAVARDCEILRQECHRLRRELDDAQARAAALLATSGEAEERLGGTISRLDDLSAAGG